jgi:hypothetical protein
VVNFLGIEGILEIFISDSLLLFNLFWSYFFFAYYKIPMVLTNFFTFSCWLEFVVIIVTRTGNCCFLVWMESLLFWKFINWLRLKFIRVELWWWEVVTGWWVVIWWLVKVFLCFRKLHLQYIYNFSFIIRKK